MSPSSKSMELLGWVVFEEARLRPFIPTYLHLIASALFPIYVGAHASLSAPSSARLPSKRTRADQDDLTDETSELAADKIEGLTPRDAVLFPLLAGLTLSSLYLVIKWLDDPSILNKVLSYYFMQAGIVFGTKFLKDTFTVARSVFLPSQYSHSGQLWRISQTKQRYDAVHVTPDAPAAHRSSPLPGSLHRLRLPTSVSDGLWRLRGLVYAKCFLNFHIHKLVTFKVPVDLLDAFAVCTSLCVTGVFTFLYKPWYVSNLIGFAFCYGSMQFMSPTTFWTGTLLLSALFCYDIYFVFYTPMMVTVATKLDVPIKLLFPRPASPAESEKGLQSLAMLGLGDIVIPGMMIALALRFDLYLHYLRMSTKVDVGVEKATYRPATGGWGERYWVGRLAAGRDLRAKEFPKTYFKAGLGGYVAGLIATLLAMQVSEKPQPALLYLVPGVLGVLWGTAALNGDLGHMWYYDENKEAKKPRKSSKRSKSQRRGTNTDGETSPSDEKRSESCQSEESSTMNGYTIPGESASLRSTTKGEQTTGTCVANSDHGSYHEASACSTSSTRSMPLSDRRKGKKAGAKKRSQQEENYRPHLLWFSIDFAPTPNPTEQLELAFPKSVGQDSDTSDESRQRIGEKGPTDKSTDIHNADPPGTKRRRIE